MGRGWQRCQVAGNPLPSSVGTTVLTEGGPQRLVTSETPLDHPAQAFQGTSGLRRSRNAPIARLSSFQLLEAWGVSPGLAIFPGLLQGHPSSLSPWEDTP